MKDSTKTMNKKDALLEIYVEELPVSFILPALEQIETLAKNLLEKNSLKYDELKTYSTPRRLALCVNGLCDRTEARTEEIAGPSVNIAFDAGNNPTKAAVGFAKSRGVEVKDLVIKETAKGKNVFAVITSPALETEKVLKGIFSQAVTGIVFPKTMVWESSKFRFARPIRSILALYGNKTIKFEIAGVKSSDFTFGLHALSSKKIKIASPEKYLGTLRNNNVIADHKLRLDFVKKSIDSVSRNLKCRVDEDPELIAEINNLVEHPAAVSGKFPERFLSLPEEILVTCMKKKQKFLPVKDQQGKLTNSFIGIRNGISENQNTVREGYERVLVASLSDAEFFYRNDSATPLESKVDKLKGIVFNEKLGTIYDKTERVKKLALWLRGRLEGSVPSEITAGSVESAARICNADLSTSVVFEYPELQGVAGKIYAGHDGKPEETARALEERYWPLAADGPLPATWTGAILSLADKTDTIAGNFSIGLAPTGSGDPYGLRRQAIGILRILRDRKLGISLEELIKQSLALLPVTPGDTVLGEIMEFFRQRLEKILETEGYKFDEVRAVLDAGVDSLPDINSRIEALKAIRALPDFQPLITAYKRAGNILKQSQKAGVRTDALKIDESIMGLEEEKELHGEYLRVKNEVLGLFEEKNYAGALQKLVSLRPSIDKFFEKVMVMDKDEKLRNNRLALLNEISALFTKIGNLSLLQ